MMADGIAFHLDSRQLEQNMQAIPAQLEAKIARQALTAGGEIVQAAAEASAPKKSGELAEDIVIKVHVNTSGDFSDNYVLIGPGYDRSRLHIRKRGKYAGQPDSSTSPGVYGKFVEEGHAPAGGAIEKKRARRRGIEIEFGGRETPPHPWLGPAFNSSKDEALETMAEVMQAGLVAVASALPK
jgi:HK97 gp10 family phage protein